MEFGVVRPLANRMQRVLEQGVIAMSLAEAVNDQGASARARYEKLEDRVLARDQVGASECYYDLVRDGRPLPEMLREAVRIHGPYTHVPYHERIDNGFVNFVNNDHCLLSARATLHLSKWLPAEIAPAEARRTLAGPRAGASRRAVARPPRPMDDAGASRPRARSLSRLSRTHAEQAGAQSGARRAGVRRPDRFAGPCLPQPFLYHRPQVLSGARHGRTGNGHRLGRRPCGALCRGAGYRRRSALVFDLRDGVQLRYPLPRAAENLCSPLRGHHGQGIGIPCKFRAADRDRGGGIPRSRVASARAGLP